MRRLQPLLITILTVEVHTHYQLQLLQLATNGTLHFNFEENDEYNYTLSDVLGKPVKTGIISPSQNEVNLQYLSTGVYILTISNTHYQQTEQIILR